MSIFPAANGQPTKSNHILYRGIITGVMILLMMIPVIFVDDLIAEREQRQKTIVKEVSSKWAGSQQISTPYLYIPYKKTGSNQTVQNTIADGAFILLPEQLKVVGNIQPEIRTRSIYKVLLYQSQLQLEGSFQFTLPSHFNGNEIIWSDIQLCIGISDPRGVTSKPVLLFNGSTQNLKNGLPTQQIDSNGLSSNVTITPEMMQQRIPFRLNCTINGNEQLQFLPLAANSSFALQSAWPNPSFDGNSLPAQSKISKSGFTANWQFNSASLPFSTLPEQTDIRKKELLFGVSMLQPNLFYDQITRCIKYALLIIGLTFSAFFLFELFQKKPVHPVQYVLVGLALAIFYTLLLSLSERIAFHVAYAIATIATVLLIAGYVKNHFRSYKTGAFFATLLFSLYGFIYVLLQLEDTSLLVGSIALFCLLALVMYATRNINWYGNDIERDKLQQDVS